MKIFEQLRTTQIHPTVILFLGGAGALCRRYWQQICAMHELSVGQGSNVPIAFLGVDADIDGVDDLPERFRLILDTKKFVEALPYYHNTWAGPATGSLKHTKKGAGMHRTIGAALATYHIEPLRSHLRSIRKWLSSFTTINKDTPLHLFMVGSTAGGTASGSFLPVAMTAQEMLDTGHDLFSHGVFFSPTFFMEPGKVAPGAHPRLACNGVAAARELHYYTYADRFRMEHFPGRLVEIHGAFPFHMQWVLSPDGEKGHTISLEQAAEAAAWKVFLQMTGILSGPETSMLSNVWRESGDVGNIQPVRLEQRMDPEFELTSGEIPEYPPNLSSFGWHMEVMNRGTQPPDPTARPEKALPYVDTFAALHQHSDDGAVNGLLGTTWGRPSLDEFSDALGSDQLTVNYIPGADGHEEYLEDTDSYCEAVTRTLVNFRDELRFRAEEVAQRYADEVENRIKMASTQSLELARLALERLSGSLEALRNEAQQQRADINPGEVKTAFDEMRDNLSTTVSNVPRVLGKKKVLETANRQYGQCKDGVRAWLAAAGQDAQVEAMQIAVAEVLRRVGELVRVIEQRQAGLRQQLAFRDSVTPAPVTVEETSLATVDISRQLGHPFDWTSNGLIDAVYQAALQFTHGQARNKHAEAMEVWETNDFRSVDETELHRHIGVLMNWAAPQVQVCDAPFGQIDHWYMGLIICSREVWARIKNLVSFPFGPETVHFINRHDIIGAYTSMHMISLGAIKEMKYLLDLARQYPGHGGTDGFLSMWPMRDKVPHLRMPEMVAQDERSPAELEALVAECLADVGELQRKIARLEADGGAAANAWIQLLREQAGVKEQELAAAQARIEETRTKLGGTPGDNQSSPENTPRPRRQKRVTERMYAVTDSSQPADTPSPEPTAASEEPPAQQDTGGGSILGRTLRGAAKGAADALRNKK